MSKILNIPITKKPLSEILEIVKKSLDTGKKLHIITLNSEMITHAQKDSEFKKVIENAGLVVPDSVGLQLAWQYSQSKSRSIFFKLPRLIKSGFSTVSGVGLQEPLEIVPGVDLSMLLIGMAQEYGYKVFLLGGKEGVGKQAENKVKELFPTLKVASYAGSDFGEKDSVEVVAKVNQYKPDILFVALGHPRQEKWIAGYLGALEAKVAIGVGGTLDFISGNVSRAPLVMRDLGLEWVYRLVRQPWRIKRQASLARFLWLLLSKKEASEEE